MDLCKYVDVFYGNGAVDHFAEDGLASKWFYIKALCGNTFPHAVYPFGKMSAGVYSGGYILVLSIITAIVDILPVLGTGTVLVPWAIYNFVTGNIGLGIGLIIMYVLITVIRQILEPRLVALNVGIHPVLTLMGMYLGVQLFGVIGIFILPITFVLVKALNDEGIIHLWGMDRRKEK